MIVTDCLQEVMSKLGGTYSAHAVALGCVINSELVAGVIYDKYNEVSMHIAIWIEGRPNAEFMHAMFDYPFNQIGVRKLVGLIYGTNDKSIRLAEHAGFIREGMITDYCAAGDMLIYTMTKDQCRFIEHRSAA